jgi:hypothetical protein
MESVAEWLLYIIGASEQFKICLTSLSRGGGGGGRGEKKIPQLLK